MFEVGITGEGLVARNLSADHSVQTRFRFLRPEGVLTHIVGDTNSKGMNTGRCPDLCNQIIHGIYIVIKRTGTLGGRRKIALDYLERLTYLDNEGTFFVQVASGPALADRFPYHRGDQGQTENYCPRDDNCDN